MMNKHEITLSFDSSTAKGLAKLRRWYLSIYHGITLDAGYEYHRHISTFDQYNNPTEETVTQMVNTLLGNSQWEFVAFKDGYNWYKREIQ